MNKHQLLKEKNEESPRLYFSTRDPECASNPQLHQFMNNQAIAFLTTQYPEANLDSKMPHPRIRQFKTYYDEKRLGLVHTTK